MTLDDLLRMERETRGRPWTVGDYAALDTLIGASRNVLRELVEVAKAAEAFRFSEQHRGDPEVGFVKTHEQLTKELDTALARLTKRLEEMG